MGSAIVAALRAAGVPATGPHGRGYDGAGDAVVLLCVPDDAIGVAAQPCDYSNFKLLIRLAVAKWEQLLFKFSNR